MPRSVGPVIFDLQGKTLTAEEREILQHPLIGGLIFFTRNYDSHEQIQSLCREIRTLRKKPFLITVDQEGGRVQRFRQGFTRLLSMGQIGKVYQNASMIGLQLAKLSGWLMAAELLAVGVDFSYAPVLDLNKEMNSVIGDRSFANEPKTVIALAHAFTQGMREAGMVAVGKHFPGHGSVTADSHLSLPVDERRYDTIAAEDMVPFAEMIKAGMEGIMVSHILFPAVDNAMPVSLSRHWIKDILRKELQFHGMVFSDCLSMNGADIGGSFPDRARFALDAGCDMVLICNHRDNVIKTLDGLPMGQYQVDSHRISHLAGQFSQVPPALKDSPQWINNYNNFIRLIRENQVTDEVDHFSVGE